MKASMPCALRIASSNPRGVGVVNIQCFTQGASSSNACKIDCHLLSSVLFLLKEDC